MASSPAEKTSPPVTPATTSEASSKSAITPPPPATPTPLRPQRTTPPVEVTDQPALWLLLLLCLALALPLLLVELHRADVTDAAEARALVQARELYQRLSDTPAGQWWHLENWVSTFNGQSSYTAQPGMSWVHALGIGLHEKIIGPVDVERLILIGRWCSAFFAGVTILGAFWAGRCIGGNYSAVFAGLLCLSTPALVWFGRLGSDAIVHAGISTLAIAAALWAIRPLKPAPSVWRQAIGWGLCGLCLAGALLVAGPIAWLTVGLPVLMMIVLCPGRIGHVLGWVAALLTGFVLVLPWTLFVYDRQPGAWFTWIEPLIPGIWYDPAGFLGKVLTRLGLVAVLLLPWTLWLLGGLGQPFSPSSKGARVRLFLGWVWFAPLALVLVSLPEGDGLSFLLPLVPAAAVLIGQTFSQFVELAAQGRYAKTWQRLCWVHLFLLVSVSVMVPLFLHLRGHVLDPYFAPLNWKLAVGMVLALWAVLFLSVRPMMRDYPGKSLIAWSAWSMLLMVMLLFPLTRGEAAHHPLRQTAPLLSKMVGDRPVYWLLENQPEHDGSKPDAVLLLYGQRNIPVISMKQWAQLPWSEGDVYLLATAPPMTALSASTPLQLTLNHRLDLPMLGRSLYLGRAVTSPDANPVQVPADHE